MKTEDDNEKKEKENHPPIPISQEPPGYMATLINKIANNISLKLNNIIFKYIEEDIVLSMNIQTLSIGSADEDWQPSFIDINPSKVLLRKLINISDLTICLDKPNAQGKIDVCQEPILYRCSLQARMIRKYHLQSAHLASIMRIDVFTENVDFKISVQQFPMLIRLYLLIQMLREIYAGRNGGQQRFRNETVINIANITGNELDESNDASYASWIWNMLPEIFPQTQEEEETDTNGHIIHNGFYANNVNIILKSQEIVSSSILQSTTAFKYQPILKLTFSGVWFDAISVGRKWYNLHGGVSYIGVFPLGQCTCGQKHNIPTVFLSGKKTTDKDVFLLDSLKDPNCCENQNINRMYNSDYQTHIQLNTKNNLLQRSPAIAIDIIGYRQFPDDAKSHGTGSISNHDGIGVSAEEYIVRLFFGNFNMKIDTSINHLWQTLYEHYEQYVYTAPYLVIPPVDSLTQLTPPSTEDYESLIDCIPLRKYIFSMNEAIIEIYSMDSDHAQIMDTNEFNLLPSIELKIDRFSINQTMPLYPDKLVNTTCQLPKSNQKLKENCYIRTSVLINDIAINVNHQKNYFQFARFGQMELHRHILLKPDLWILTPMQTKIYQFSAINSYLTFNKSQFILMQRMIEHYRSSERSVYRRLLKNFNSYSNEQNIKFPLLEFSLRNIQTKIEYIDNVIGVNVTLSSIIGCDYENDKKYLFLTSEPNDILFQLFVQYPKDKKHSPSVNLKLSAITISVDHLLQQFIKFNDSVSTINDHLGIEEKTQRRVRKASKMSRQLVRTESVHSNSLTTQSLVNSVSKARESEKLQLIDW